MYPMKEDLSCHDLVPPSIGMLCTLCLVYVLLECFVYIYRYGFDYGNIHVVMMSTEHDFTTNSEQHTFLDNHLKNVNRSITPWLIFAGHRPMYVDSTDDKKNSSDQPVATLLRQHVEPLLKVMSAIAPYVVVFLY